MAEDHVVLDLVPILRSPLMLSQRLACDAFVRVGLLSTREATVQGLMLQFLLTLPWPRGELVTVRILVALWGILLTFVHVSLLKNLLLVADLIAGPDSSLSSLRRRLCVFVSKLNLRSATRGITDIDRGSLGLLSELNLRVTS